MSTIAYNLIASPFAGLGLRFMKKCEIIGYARAATVLTQQGFYEEANRCRIELDKLRDE